MKVNTDVGFTTEKIGIGMIIRNHIRIPILAKGIPHLGSFSIDYGELTGVIEGYIVKTSFTENMLIESDLLTAIRSLQTKKIIFHN